MNFQFYWKVVTKNLFNENAKLHLFTTCYAGLIPDFSEKSSVWV